jgi:hypothetical protein
MILPPPPTLGRGSMSHRQIDTGAIDVRSRNPQRDRGFRRSGRVRGARHGALDARVDGRKEPRREDLSPGGAGRE